MRKGGKIGDWHRLGPAIAELAHDPAASVEDNARRAERREYVEGLIAAYVHHVPSMARRFRHPLGYDMESAASHNLYVSAYTYDPTRGYAFYSWWHYSMRAVIWRLIHVKARNMMETWGGRAILEGMSRAGGDASGPPCTDHGQDRVDIEDAMARLGWRDYEAIIGKYYLGDGATEAAERAGINMKAASQRARSALRHLHRIMEGDAKPRVGRPPGRRDEPDRRRVT